jgi:hypothetical protein
MIRSSSSESLIRPSEDTLSFKEQMQALELQQIKMKLKKEEEEIRVLQLQNEEKELELMERWKKLQEIDS